MAEIILKAVKIDRVSADRDRMCASFDVGGIHHYIWFHPDTKQHTGTLFKKIERRRPRPPRTIYLNPSARKNQPIVAALFAEIDKRKLIASALAAEDAKQAAYEAEQQRQLEAERLRDAAPVLFDVVKRGRQKLATYVKVYPGDKELRSLLKAWDAAVAKATGGTYG